MASFASPVIGGGGNVSASTPASSTDNAAVRYDGATGKVLQDSGVLIDDSSNVTTAGTLNSAKIHAGLNIYSQVSFGGL